LTTPVSLTTSATSNSPPGTYTIVASGATSPDYAIAFVNGVLTVTAPQLVSLAVTSATNSITVGQTQQLTATGTFSDNSTQNLTTTAAWVSSVPTVATISSTGLVTAVAPGSSAITASQSNIVGTLILTVTSSNAPASMSFTNSTAIAIPLSGAASPYPSAISVSGLQGTVSNVTVQLNNVNHRSPHRMNVLLVSPTGQSVLLMSDAGGHYSITNATLTFADSALGSLPESSQITSGTYLPTEYGTAGNLPGPAPAGPYATVQPVFNGILPNGAWSLYVADTNSADPTGRSSGSIAGGWSLTITVTNAAMSGDLEAASIQSAVQPSGKAKTQPTVQSVALPSAQVEIEHLATSPGGQAQLTLSGQPGQTYLLEMSTDLIHWQVLESGALQGARYVFVDKTATGSDHRFYRVITAQ